MIYRVSEVRPVRIMISGVYEARRPANAPKGKARQAAENSATQTDVAAQSRITIAPMDDRLHACFHLGHPVERV